MTVRLAVWSGPRNLSTAMMYAFAQRSDCYAVDEPFYAAYLIQADVQHPMQSEILAAQPHHPKGVLTNLSQIAAPVVYEKQMAHHILDDWSLDWLADRTNIFLIRHPARVLASYGAKLENPTLEDIGLPQQVRLLRGLRAMGHDPLILDSAAIRNDPEGTLRQMCKTGQIPFDPAMLSWPAGPKPFDGAWAPHWYDAVHQSSGFAGPEGPIPSLSGSLAQVLERALPLYEMLKTNAIALD